MGSPCRPFMSILIGKNVEVCMEVQGHLCSHFPRGKEDVSMYCHKMNVYSCSIPGKLPIWTWTFMDFHLHDIPEERNTMSKYGHDINFSLIALKSRLLLHFEPGSLRSASFMARSRPDIRSGLIWSGIKLTFDQVHFLS